MGLWLSLTGGKFAFLVTVDRLVTLVLLLPLRLLVTESGYFLLHEKAPHKTGYAQEVEHSNPNGVIQYLILVIFRCDRLPDAVFLSLRIRLWPRADDGLRRDRGVLHAGLCVFPLVAGAKSAETIIDKEPLSNYNTYAARINDGKDSMQKKLTITIAEEVYEGLYTVVGPRRISQFIEDLVRPLVTMEDLNAAYREMAEDEAREAEALEWAEATIGDIDNTTW